MGAYEGFLKFKDVVKSNPITPGTETASLSADKQAAIEKAAAKLSEASYGFLGQADWLSDVYQKPLPGATPKDLLKAVDKAIGSIDAKGVTTLADYTAVNAALGKLVASVPQAQTMDVFNAFSKVVNPVVNANLFSMVNGADAAATYKAFLDFKDVVKASQR